MALSYLPITLAEIDRLGWDYVDIVLISGDAYVDHPSFGAAVIGRVLERGGYRVAIIPMPGWRDSSSIAIFGRPRLFFGVSSGNVDSMLARYTAFKKVRSDDPYAPGGRGGRKPERAVIVYCNMIKSIYKDVPIVIGGIEASMRRLAHYDFWDNRVRRSILLDSRADILVYGMGERQILDIARRIDAGKPLAGIEGTVEIAHALPDDALMLPPEEEVCADKKAFLEFYRMFLMNHQRRILAQPAGKRFIVHHPPPAMEPGELDAIYELPFARMPHPSYAGHIPAFEMICNSISSHRGCVSSCSFCSLGLHQGRRIIRRSRGSIRAEIDRISGLDYFRGHITDIGGPSANMYGTECAIGWKCARESCTFPALCVNLKINTKSWTALLDDSMSLKGMKHVTVGSGIRYDLFMVDDENLLKPLVRNHVSGQLKIAPEHTSHHVLEAMGKTPLYELEEFAGRFSRHAKSTGRELYLLPYLMSCHPGCGLTDMVDMKQAIQSIFHYVPEQVQAFIPLPMTLSSVMYYTGVNPITGEEIFVASNPGKRRRQHSVLVKK